jgi:c-di-GMP-binding flagellar brake protein YcgR
MEEPTRENESGGTDSEEGTLISEERRTAERRKLKLKKIFSAEIMLDGTPQMCYLYIFDISEGGMRIHTDFSFPENKVIPVKFYLDEPLEIAVQVVWQKILVGGMHVIGIKYIDLDEESHARINRFMDKYSPEGKRKSYRLNRVLSVEMELSDRTEKFYALTLDISPQGMRITNDFPLPEGETVPFRLLLDVDRPPVELNARIAWQKETSFETFMIGMEFIGVTSEATMRINDYIDKAMSGELDRQVIKTQDMSIFESEGGPSS